MRFQRFVAMAMIFALSFSMVACGPSKEMKALQAQYSALQQAPVMPAYSYTVTKPFLVMGKLVSTPQELANALATRPAMVVVVVRKSEAYSDMMAEADMQRVGYKLLGKKSKGKDIEMTFQADSSAMEAAQNQRQQQLQSLQAQMNQQQMADSQANQTYATVGIAAGTILVGVLGSVLATAASR